MDQEQTVINPRTPGVVIHEIGEHTFLEINGSMLSFDDLVKYRKVFIANNQYYVYLYAGLSAIVMLLSFFTKTPIRIVMGCVNFSSSVAILLLFKRVSTHFSTYACISLFAGLISCGYSVLYGSSKVHPVITILILLICVIEFFMLVGEVGWMDGR